MTRILNSSTESKSEVTQPEIRFQILPEVSVITSWDIPLGPHVSKRKSLSGLEDALRHGVTFFDLYFLEQMDLAIYLDMLNVSPEHNPNLLDMTPLDFVAALTSDYIKKIAGGLWDILDRHYRGRRMGLVPRIVFVATYFPEISDVDEGVRRRAVQAIINTCELSRELGAKGVEIVGGAVLAESERSGAYDRMADSIVKIGSSLVSDARDGIGVVPSIALELEPGYNLLLNQWKALEDVWLLVEQKFREEGICKIPDCVGINIDVAHCFMMDILPRVFRENISSNWMAAEKWIDRVRHMHISDHLAHARKGVHSADGVPGSWHWYLDYEGFLKIAVELSSRDDVRYSGVVAVELEACNDIDVVLDGIRTTRRWLEKARGDVSLVKRRAVGGVAIGRLAEFRGGALLCIDLGNSTRRFFQGGDSDIFRFEELMTRLTSAVARRRGSTLSFTGDGFIALFESSLWPGRDQSAVMAALDAAREFVSIVQEHLGSGRAASVGDEGSLTLRCALHFGEVLVPQGGYLYQEVLGEHVVAVARLCSWLGDVVERYWQPSLGALLGVSDRAFASLTTEAIPEEWASLMVVEPGLHWGALRLKGLRDDVLAVPRNPKEVGSVVGGARVFPLRLEPAGGVVVAPSRGGEGP